MWFKQFSRGRRTAKRLIKTGTNVFSVFGGKISFFEDRHQNS
jgi:hypothetical protein